MEVREANSADLDAIEEIARRSLQASYALSPAIIDEAITQWYGHDAFASTLEQSDRLVLVATRGDEVVGFSENTVGTYSDVNWLHVMPRHRGRGVGSELFERSRSALQARGAEHLRGRVLNVNTDGNAFYEHHGLQKIDVNRVEIGGRSFVENVYGETEMATRKTVTTPEGGRLYVASETDQGSNGAFRAVYTDPERNDQYGYYCDRCDGLATAMDAMGRLECSECGNVRKPMRWDAAYL
ncbi:GNAT family N-acetyltransferase [Natrialbaceae archaeon AArc-T1-2]|uniref:GNAT family N-acetyltransferase n=1 Tax=Natrialbaceae archaeon AArc-T1-2 TaxID=3053904 RepID=UPI00255AC191|nr:GNAT family N-acetyltransferase [Natrialbaceae archaeon AArc-T1-2]WIV68173.1 GNAT family N-acetyltransferase [Natrialbaceae archaeon AArc-T1-2]